MMRSALASVVVMFLVAAGCSESTPDASPHSTVVFARNPVTSYVETRGEQFVVAGEAFRFVGVNIYDAAASDRYSCDQGNRMSDAELGATLQKLHDSYGATVLRFWAYQTYTASGGDFSGMDRVIAAASRVGMRVIPVLEDGPGHCTTMQEVVPKADYEDGSWFTDGYKKPFGKASLSYRDYVKTVAEHYKSEPAILGWSLFNEAETAKRNAADQSVLIDFARDMVQVIRTVDQNHLITLGTQGNGAPGASGPDFLALYSMPELDFAEVHDWGYWGDDGDPMPGGQNGVPPDPDSSRCQQLDAPIGCSFAQARKLGKPLFVGEAGIPAEDPAARNERSTELRAKMDAAFSAGASGYLLWRVTKNATYIHDITLTSNDPVLDEMAEVAVGLR
jgi:endo-1,4-beta-mannosidase